MAGIGNYESKPFSLKSGNNPEFKMMGSSPLRAGCAPGDPGCGGNFKVNKKGTVVSRTLKKIGSSISRLFQKGKSKRRTRQDKNRTKDYYNTKGGSHKTVRYL